MHSTVLSFLPLALAPLQALALPAGCDVNPAPSQPGKAIYLITNAKENAVVALKVGQDGLLSTGTRTATGGAGGNGVDDKGQAATPDALFSQSALTIAGSVCAHPSMTSCSCC